MSMVSCACGTVSITSVGACSYYGCHRTLIHCTHCKPHSVCNTCGHAFCDAHLVACSRCAQPTCDYCAERVAGHTGLLLDRACVLAIVPAGAEPIAIHPRAAAGAMHGLTLLKQFNPPVRLLTYAASKRARARKRRPAGVQAEHFIPNSCFMTGPGRSGHRVPGAAGYTEDAAMAYWVADDQKAGTEHKFLTDRERAFCNTLQHSGKHATLQDWLNFMQHVTVTSLLAHRSYRRPIPPGAVPSHVRRHAAQQAACTIRQQMESHFVGALGVALSTVLRPGLAPAAPPPPHPPGPAQRFDL